MAAKLPKDVLGIQHQVRENAMDLQDWMSDFKKWEEDIKKRDTGLLKGDLNPTRGKAVPAVRKKGFAEMIPSGVKGPKDAERERAKAEGGAEGEERIKPKTYQDYNQWDNFVHKNLDKMLDDFDETDRQEQEEKHREKLAAERAAIAQKEEEVRQRVEEAERLRQAGNDLLRKRELAGARAKYGESIALLAHNPIAYANRAQAWLAEGTAEGAAAAVQDSSLALHQDPRYVKALLRRATAFLASDPPQGGAAEADLRRARLLEPNNKQAKEHLERLLAPPLTPQQKQAQEKEEQRRRLQEERERRRLERGGARIKAEAAPRTGAELHRRWKHLRSSSSSSGEEEAARLPRLWASLPPESLPALFKGEVEEDLLMDLLRWLRHTLLLADAPHAAKLIAGLVRVPRVSLALRLCGKEAQAWLREAAEEVVQQHVQGAEGLREAVAGVLKA